MATAAVMMSCFCLALNRDSPSSLPARVLGLAFDFGGPELPGFAVGVTGLTGLAAVGIKTALQPRHRTRAPSSCSAGSAVRRQSGHLTRTGSGPGGAAGAESRGSGT